MSASHRFSNDLRRRPESADEQVHLTPSYILEPVRRLLGKIDLDPCTTPGNPVGAVKFYTLPIDGAAQSWDAATIFCNPPYGEARIRWVRRCAEAALTGAQVVLLIPAHTDTRIWQEAMRTASSVLFVKGRVKFGIPRENGRQQAASHPSCLIGWNVDLRQIDELGVVFAVPRSGLFDTPPPTPSVCDPNALTGTCRFDHDHSEDDPDEN